MFEAAYREVVLEGGKAEWPVYKSVLELEEEAEAEADGDKGKEGEGEKAPEEEEVKVEEEKDKVAVNKDDIALIVSSRVPTELPRSALTRGRVCNRFASSRLSGAKRRVRSGERPGT